MGPKKQGNKVRKNNSDHFCETNIRFYTLSRCTWRDILGLRKGKEISRTNFKKMKADTIMKFKSNLPLSNFILMLLF